MDWIVRGMWVTGVILLLSLLISLFVSKPAWLKPFLRVVAFLCVVLLIVGAWRLLTRPPGGEDVIPQPDRPQRGDSEPITERLRPLKDPWDSEDFADWPVAELMATISNESYRPPVDAQGALLQLGFTQCETLVDASMVGYMASVDDVAVIAFRGTDDDFDWIVNLNRFAIESGHGEVHKGFFQSYRNLKTQIETVLGKWKPKHVWVTGHSLGGAIAIVCGYDLVANQKQSVSGVITFGQPMAVRQKLAEYIDTDKVLLNRYAHYVNENDIVARIPPSYLHCGSLVWFTGGGILRSKPKGGGMRAQAIGESIPDVVELEPLSPEEFDQVKEELELAALPSDVEPLGAPSPASAPAHLPWISDHSMVRYLEKIRSLND